MEQAQPHQEPLSCGLHVHTQARKEPAGSLAAPSTAGRAMRAQLAPGTPHSASSQHIRISFGLASLYDLCKSQAPVCPVTSCFLLLDLKGSLELPTGFSRNGTPPAWNCNPQHSHTQRNSRSVIEFTFYGGNEPVTHTGSSCFIPSLPTLHLPAANKRKFVSELFLSCFQPFVSVTQQLLLLRAPEPTKSLMNPHSPTPSQQGSACKLIPPAPLCLCSTTLRGW